MILYFVMGFIIGIGLHTGIRTIQLVNKKMGIIQLLLTILTPISVLVWCLKKKILFLEELIGNF